MKGNFEMQSWKHRGNMSDSYCWWLREHHEEGGFLTRILSVITVSCCRNKHWIRKEGRTRSFTCNFKIQYWETRELFFKLLDPFQMHWFTGMKHFLPEINSTATTWFGTREFPALDCSRENITQWWGGLLWTIRAQRHRNVGESNFSFCNNSCFVI